MGETYLDPCALLELLDLIDSCIVPWDTKGCSDIVSLYARVRYDDSRLKVALTHSHYTIADMYIEKLGSYSKSILLHHATKCIEDRDYSSLKYTLEKMEMTTDDKVNLLDAVLETEDAGLINFYLHIAGIGRREAILSNPTKEWVRIRLTRIA